MPNTHCQARTDTTHNRPRTADHALLSKRCQARAAKRTPRTTRFQPRTAKHALPTTCRQLLAAGHAGPA
eukprot:2276805-Alexandrium_andersonii.AAC.1